jgi:WD40 repeat protein
MKDLYWYRYKIAASRVDGISFTPDSKAIIIVYRYSNPIMYDLGTGKKILEFEKNGEENNRDGFHCTYTDTGSHFAYTSTKSFTLWSLSTGKITQQIMNDSPIKIISNEFLICISSDLNCDIIRIANEENIINFKLKGVESLDDILDARCTPNLTSFLYVTKKGIIRYVFLEQEYKGVQRFNFVVEKATISDDCKYVMKTNMNHVSIHDLEKQEIMSTFLQEKFKEYRIDFNIKRLIIIDDISIRILDYQDEGAPEKYVWLNKNPTKFEDVRFSRDCKILLARVNRNNAIAYDLKTGFILKKWQNIDENWIDFAITKYGGDKIATKSHLLLVRIWNFSTGREDASFYGFDSHSLSFNANGNYLACGTKVGPEIARVWDIYNQKYGIFRYNGKNNNYHTVVHLTSPEPIRLICCAIDQQPLVFDTNTKQLLVTCDCVYRFEEIYEIDSDLRYDVFIVKGRDEAKRNIGILYRISDGALLEVYENYTVLELAKNTGVLISKCDNVNGGKLTSTNIKNLGDPILNDFHMQADTCKLLNDNKCAVIEYGDDNNKEFNLINVENGAYIGQFVFSKKNFERKSATYITVDPVDNEIYFRYFEFLSPQETMIFKKKNIFSVEDETE